MSSSDINEKPALIGTPALPGRRRRTASIAVAGVLLAAGAGGAYYYTTQSQQAAAPAAAGADTGGSKQGGGRFGGGGDRAMPVVAAVARTESMDVRLAALGNVVPRNSVVVRARVDGPLLRLHFKEGQQVKAEIGRAHV